MQYNLHSIFSHGWYEKIKLAGAASGHFTTTQFRDLFSKFKKDDQSKARQKFELVMQNPKSSGIHRLLQNPSKRFDVYGVPAGQRMRALGVSFGSCFIWYWIGTHEEYNNMLKKEPPAGQITAIASYILLHSLCGMKTNDGDIYNPKDNRKRFEY